MRSSATFKTIPSRGALGSTKRVGTMTVPLGSQASTCGLASFISSNPAP